MRSACAACSHRTSDRRRTSPPPASVCEALLPLLLQLCTVTFDTVMALSYSVAITFRGTPLPGSPFSVTVASALEGEPLKAACDLLPPYKTAFASHKTPSCLAAPRTCQHTSIVSLAKLRARTALGPRRGRTVKRVC